MQAVSYIVEYDENSCAWLVQVDNPSFRVALTHGTMLNVSVVHVDRYQDPPCGLCQGMLPLLDGLAICEACATRESRQEVQQRSAHFAFDTPVSIAKLDTQGLMFTKIAIGDQVLHIPWLPKPGGTR